MNSIFNKNSNKSQNNKFSKIKAFKAGFSLNGFSLPNPKQLKYIGKYLNTKELWLIRFAFLILFSSIFFIGNNFYKSHLEYVPLREGEYREALVGSPKYINPLYSSVNDVDSDIASLVYSSLFRYNKEHELTKDLVQDFEVLEQGKQFKLKIKKNVIWHSGEKLTAEDIIFTFNKIIDTDIGSPLQKDFLGVSIEKLNEFEVKFVLENSNAFFLNKLTFGILPKHIWNEINAEGMLFADMNIKPIGSGPYKKAKILKDLKGNIKEYLLEVNEDYYGVDPYLNIHFKFYFNIEEAIVALNNDDVDGISFLPLEYKEQLRTPKKYENYNIDLPQVSVININQENVNLAKKQFRQALAYAIDKENIIDNVLVSGVKSVGGPLENNNDDYSDDLKLYNFNIAESKKLLEAEKFKFIEVTSEELIATSTDDEKEDLEKKAEIGVGNWLQDEDDDFVVLKLVIIENDKNKKIADTVKSDLKKIGVKIEISIVEHDLVFAVIQDKEYDLLLLPQQFTRNSDLYDFWHSSQAENGMNIVDFQDGEVDTLIEESRMEIDAEKRKEKLVKIQNIITEEVPVIYLFADAYHYLQFNNLKGFEVNKVYSPTDRFLNIEEWYIKEGKKLVF